MNIPKQTFSPGRGAAVALLLLLVLDLHTFRGTSPLGCEAARGLQAGAAYGDFSSETPAGGDDISEASSVLRLSHDINGFNLRNNTSAPSSNATARRNEFVTSSRAFLFWDTFNTTIKLMNTSEMVLTVSHIETSDVFETRITSTDLARFKPSFTTMATLYSFLAEALKVAAPRSAAEDIAGPPGSMSCWVWMNEDRSYILVKAAVQPAFAFFDPVVVRLDLPVAQRGSTEDRLMYTLQKLTDDYIRANREQARKFGEVVAAQQQQIDAMKAAQQQQIDTMKLQLNNRVFIRSHSLPLDVQAVAVVNVSQSVRLDKSSGMWHNSYLPSADSVYAETVMPWPVGGFGYWETIRRRGTEAVQRSGKIDNYYTYDSYNGRWTASSWDNYYAYPRELYDAIYASSKSAWSMMQAMQTGMLPFGVSSDELRPLTLCTNITYLDLTSANLTHLDFLPALTRLETLVIRNSTSISSISSLKGLRALTRLDLSGCSNITDVEALNSLPMLTWVNLKGTGVINKQTLTKPQLAIVGI